MYYNNVLDLIGDTPLMCLKETTGLNIFAKAEFLNPGGSVKDRIAKNMIEVAEADGTLKPGMTIIEPTSGNTGIGLAFAGVRKGYKVIIVMPENMSEERKKVIRAFGAELVLTEPELSIGGAVDKAVEIAQSDPEKYFMPQQFVNPANPDAHYRTTAVEICEQVWEAEVHYRVLPNTCWRKIPIRKLLRSSQKVFRRYVEMDLEFTGFRELGMGLSRKCWIQS